MIALHAIGVHNRKAIYEHLQGIRGIKISKH